MQTNIIINVIDSETSNHNYWPKNMGERNNFPNNNRIFNLCVNYYFEQIFNTDRLVRVIGDAIYDKAKKKSRIMPGQRIWLYLNSELIHKDSKLQQDIIYYIDKHYGIRPIEPCIA